MTRLLTVFLSNTFPERFFKNVTHPYAVRFQPFLQTVEQHVTRVNGLVALGQGRAIAENITITKQTRNLIAMSNWKQDETNQAVKQLATLFYGEFLRAVANKTEVCVHSIKRDSQAPFLYTINVRCFIISYNNSKVTPLSLHHMFRRLLYLSGIRQEYLQAFPRSVSRLLAYYFTCTLLTFITRGTKTSRMADAS